MKTILALSVLALGIGLATGKSSMAADQTPKPNVGTTTHHAIFMPPPRKHANYECANGNCTCSNQRDCSAMVSDGVCKDGTYNNQSCVAKTQ